MKKERQNIPRERLESEIRLLTLHRASQRPERACIPLWHARIPTFLSHMLESDIRARAEGVIGGGQSEQSEKSGNGGRERLHLDVLSKDRRHFRCEGWVLALQRHMSWDARVME